MTGTVNPPPGSFLPRLPRARGDRTLEDYSFVTATGGTVPRTLADWMALASATVTINVMDPAYGAVGDGTTDDTTAVRLAVAAWKAATVAVSGVATYQRAKLLFPAGYKFVISGSLNCQSMNGGAFVEAEGAVIIAKCTGKTLFDFIGSHELSWNGGIIVGDPSNIPAIGIQMARPSNAGYGGFGFQFTNLTVAGKFSRCCIYNCCGENHTYIGCYLLNSVSTGNALIIDGCNHYGCVTDFTDTTCPTDTAQSCSMHTIIGGIYGFGASAVVATNVVSLRVLNVTPFTGGSGGGLELVAVAGVSSFLDIVWDTLVEAVTGAVVVTRTASGAVSITNLTVRTGNNAATTALIVAGTNVTTLTLNNLVIDAATGSTTWFSGTVSYPGARINGGTNPNIQTFTADGTYTPTPGMKYCLVEAVGGGGGGGGCAASPAGSVNMGGGGGAGAYARTILTAAQIGTSKAVDIGAGGAGGTAGNNAGTAGSNTTLGSTLLVAAGGSGGGGVATAVSGGSAGAGGTIAGSTGTIKTPGAPGRSGFAASVLSVVGMNGGGAGGGTMWGEGGTAVVTLAGGNGTGYGAGGGGGCDYNAAGAKAGGNGTDGYMIITEYFQ